MQVQGQVISVPLPRTTHLYLPPIQRLKYQELTSETATQRLPGFAVICLSLKGAFIIPCFVLFMKLLPHGHRVFGAPEPVFLDHGHCVCACKLTQAKMLFSWQMKEDLKWLR